MGPAGTANAQKNQKHIYLKDQVLVIFGSLPFSLMLSQFVGEEKVGSNER